MYVYLQGSDFQQNNVLTSNNDHVINNNVINIYIVYKLDPTASTRDDTFTVQNALFGATEITKNADISKYNYKGYGICFDEGGRLSEGSINSGRNVIIFSVHENSVIHSNNKTIFILWVKIMFKESTTRHFMLAKYTVKILFNHVKSSN